MKWTTAMERKIVALRNAGSTWNEVGAEMGVSAEAARRHARIRGLKLKSAEADREATTR